MLQRGISTTQGHYNHPSESYGLFKVSASRKKIKDLGSRVKSNEFIFEKKKRAVSSYKMKNYYANDEYGINMSPNRTTRVT
jgi:hypothetical protein